MTRVETRINKILTAARSQALSELSAEAKAVLPEGWRLTIAVGWGLFLFDADGKTAGEVSPYMNLCRSRYPKGVISLFKGAATFHDTFGAGNEVLTRRGLSYLGEKE